LAGKTGENRKSKRMELYKIVCLLLATFLVPAEQRPVRKDLLVAAAASLSGLAPELTRALHDAAGIDVRFNFAASNTLARQIVEGARVDAFISADAAQMAVVERAGRVVAGTRTDVVGNQLVVIVGPGTAVLPRPDDLGSPAIRRVALGDPSAVPAGVYAKQWLETVRLWSAVQPKVVPLPSSPSVVAAVSEGRADAGVVYLSDAANFQRSRVRIAHRVAVDDAPPIVYPAAAITGGRITVAQEFIAFLRSAKAQEIFAAAGFRPLGAR
jgi:molybdate transport system substrate-binding protein